MCYSPGMPHPKHSDHTAQEKAHARYLTKKLIAQGKHAPMQPCEVCGAEPADLHHIDYDDPGRTMWLCEPHHGAYHSQFGKPAPLDWQADIRAAVRRIDDSRLAARSQKLIEEAESNL